MLVLRQSTIFQSTPPARGATLRGGTGGRDGAISIHTPREGGDHSCHMRYQRLSERFNPHPPRGGRLLHFRNIGRGILSFNPHPPRGGRLLCQLTPQDHVNVSIHTPREGGDRSGAGSLRFQRQFQSTPPARGATPLSSCTTRALSFQSTPPARGATR